MSVSIERTKLIEVPLYKTLSMLDINCDEAKSKLAIWEAQQIYIMPLISTALYNKILNDVKNDTLSGYYLTLYQDYIVNTLVYYTNYMVAPHLKFNWASRGIEVKNGENSNSVDDTQLVKLRSEEKNKAEFFAQRLNDYLNANLAQFPELNQNNTADKRPRNNSSYTVPMYLGCDDYENEKRYYS